MPFIDSIRENIGNYPPGSVNRIVLDYLLENAVGRVNARGWPAIDAHLRSHGIEIRQQTFQYGLIKASREGDMYIGSYDKNPCRGYFIIADQEDAELMASWYEARIQRETQHLDHLRELIVEQWG